MPASLFDPKTGLMNEANKPDLATKIKTIQRTSEPSKVAPEGSQFVIDGGHLLYKVAWKKKQRCGLKDLCFNWLRASFKYNDYKS